MKKLSIALLSMGVLFAYQANADDKGGYQGPSLQRSVNTEDSTNTQPISVNAARALPDDTKVFLRGIIVQHLKDDKYLFKDDSGNITVKIDKDKWKGQTVVNNNWIELTDKIQHEDKTVQIEAESVNLIRVK